MVKAKASARREVENALETPGEERTLYRKRKSKRQGIKKFLPHQTGLKISKEQS